MTKDDKLAEAIWGTLQSVNVADSNLEPANVVDALANVANGLFAIAKALNNLKTITVHHEERQEN
jgi:hypothetical protein